MRKDTENKEHIRLKAENKFRKELRESKYMLKSVLELSERLMSTFDIRRVARLFCMSLAGNLGVNKISVFVASHGKDRLECIYSLGVGIKLDIESINVTSAFLKWLGGETIPAPIDNIYTGKYAELLEKQDWLEVAVRAGFAYVCPLNFGASLTGLVFVSGRVNGEGFDKYAKEFLNIFLRIGSVVFKNRIDFKSVIKASSERESFSVVKSKLMNHRSFELNTPLTVLKSTLWSIESDAVSEALMLDMAKDAVKYLESGVNELAGISEINFDGIGLQLGRADISAIVEECLQKTIPEIEEKHISVIFNEKIYREAMVDRVKIKIAVGEIIDNAVRFLSEGGTLKITAEGYEMGPNEMEGVELKCWDNSWGMNIFPKQKEMEKRNEQVELTDILKKQLRDIAVGSWTVLRIKDNGVG
ncbi:HAMP domain-containing histidine kinase, partial [bacterium]|nr:HAMP domain-containing histidine kinase [bacterium]